MAHYEALIERDSAQHVARAEVAADNVLRLQREIAAVEGEISRTLYLSRYNDLVREAQSLEVQLSFARAELDEFCARVDKVRAGYEWQSRNI